MALPLAALVATGFGFLASRGELLYAAGSLALIALLAATLVSGTMLVTLLAVAVLLQPPLGNIGGIPYLQLDELLVPGLLLVVAFRAALSKGSSTSALTKNARSSVARRINIAIGVYAFVIASNFLRSKYLLPSSVAGTRRAYYDYFVALGAYLIFYLIFISSNMKWDRFLRFLYMLTMGVSIVGLTAVLLHIPLNFGNLRYSVYDFNYGAVRVGFLETSGIVGMALIFTTKGRGRRPAGMLFAAALVASGGRAAVIGAVVAVAAYLAITHRSRYVIFTGMVFLLLAIVAPGIQANPQTQRLSELNQKEFAADGRLLLYNRALEDFASSPLVGTGIGVPAFVSTPDPRITAFYEAQLEVGGHATYTSLLKNLGLLGFLPFMAAMIFAIAGLIPRVYSDRLSAFFFVFLSAQVVSMFASGNGSDPVYFFALAGSSAVLASRKKTGGPSAGLDTSD
jgi:hypothetical protein